MAIEAYYYLEIPWNHLCGTERGCLFSLDSAYSDLTHHTCQASLTSPILTLSILLPYSQRVVGT